MTRWLVRDFTFLWMNTVKVSREQGYEWMLGDHINEMMVDWLGYGTWYNCGPNSLSYPATSRPTPKGRPEPVVCR